MIRVLYDNRQIYLGDQLMEPDLRDTKYLGVVEFHSGGIQVDTINKQIRVKGTKFQCTDPNCGFTETFPAVVVNTRECRKCRENIKLGRKEAQDFSEAPALPSMRREDIPLRPVFRLNQPGMALVHADGYIKWESRRQLGLDFVEQEKRRWEEWEKEVKAGDVTEVVDVTPVGFHFKDWSVLRWNGSPKWSPFRACSFSSLWGVKSNRDSQESLMPSGTWSLEDSPRKLRDRLTRWIDQVGLDRGKWVNLFMGTDRIQVCSLGHKEDGLYLIREFPKQEKENG